MIDKKWLVILGLAAAVILGYFLNDYLRPGPETLMGRARTAFNRNDYRSASPLFLRVIETTSRHSGLRNEAALFHAVCLVRQGDPARGGAALKQFLADYPSSFWSPEAYFNLAECEVNLGRPGLARQIYRRIIADFPTTSWSEYAKERLKKWY